MRELCRHNNHITNGTIMSRPKIPKELHCESYTTRLKPVVRAKLFELAKQTGIPQTVILNNGLLNEAHRIQSDPEYKQRIYSYWLQREIL